jgi:hypothetical protein
MVNFNILTVIPAKAGIQETFKDPRPGFRVPLRGPGMTAFALQSS